MNQDGTVEVSTHFANGTVVDGRYEIVKTIGSGGFATVYMAMHLHMRRPVALKALGLQLADSEIVRERFLREAQAASDIGHTNIVTIHDFGFHGERSIPYMVMELLNGHELETELVEGGPMSLERAVRVLLPCLDALGRAHDAGIVHKDLKPANLFLRDAGTDDETLVLLDFGVASLLYETSLRLTTSGQMIGTPQYMAPEYIRNLAVSPAVDVYQMGLIFAEMLIGRPVIQGSNVFACLVNHTKGKLEVPKTLMDSPLGEILRKATHIEPSERYANARELQHALASLPTLEFPNLALDQTVNLTRDPHNAETATRGADVSDERTDGSWPSVKTLTALGAPLAELDLESPNAERDWEHRSAEMLASADTLPSFDEHVPDSQDIHEEAEPSEDDSDDVGLVRAVETSIVANSSSNALSVPMERRWLIPGVAVAGVVLALLLVWLGATLFGAQSPNPATQSETTTPNAGTLLNDDEAGPPVEEDSTDPALATALDDSAEQDDTADTVDGGFAAADDTGLSGKLDATTDAPSVSERDPPARAKRISPKARRAAPTVPKATSPSTRAVNPASDKPEESDKPNKPAPKDDDVILLAP